MDNYREAQPGRRSLIRDWINPARIYNPLMPAGRLVFLWGLVVYPFVVIFLVLSVVIGVMEAASGGVNISDYLGIVTYIFMLVWVVAVVCICRRRLLDLGRSPRWVWLAILPVVNLIFFLYLLLKAGAGRQPA